MAAYEAAKAQVSKTHRSVLTIFMPSSLSKFKDSTRSSALRGQENVEALIRNPVIGKWKAISKEEFKDNLVLPLIKAVEIVTPKMFSFANKCI